MAKRVELPNLGDEVKVSLEKVQDRLPGELKDFLKTDSIGTIIDFKLTDGLGIGVILEFKNKQKCWFFESEIEINDDLALSKGEDNASKIINISIQNKASNYAQYKDNIKYNKSNAIKEILNPLIFINWFIYSTKDIF